jgi:hypothetical protein
MWNPDRTIAQSPDMPVPELRVADFAAQARFVGEDKPAFRKSGRTVRLNPLSTHVPLFHAWKP